MEIITQNTIHIPEYGGNLRWAPISPSDGNVTLAHVRAYVPEQKLEVNFTLQQAMLRNMSY